MRLYLPVPPKTSVRRITLGRIGKCKTPGVAEDRRCKFERDTVFSKFDAAFASSQSNRNSFSSTLPQSYTRYSTIDHPVPFKSSLSDFGRLYKETGEQCVRSHLIIFKGLRFRIIVLKKLTAARSLHHGRICPDVRQQRNP